MVTKEDIKTAREIKNELKEYLTLRNENYSNINTVINFLIVKIAMLQNSIGGKNV